jgi:hypothetical protein
MTTNRLTKRTEGADTYRPNSAQEWCDYGNQMLAGMIPTSKGDYIRRSDVHWVVRDGQPCIEWAVPPQGTMGRA